MPVYMSKRCVGGGGGNAIFKRCFNGTKIDFQLILMFSCSEFIPDAWRSNRMQACQGLV